MPLFSYIARTKDDHIERGTMSGEHAEDVRENLRKKGWTAEEVTETKTPEPQVSFTPSMPWTTVEDKKDERKTMRQMKAEQTAYVPFVDTLRLFAGWLLAWYGFVYLLGDLKSHLAVDLPFIDALFTSSLVLRFTFGTFLFLLFTNIHDWMSRGIGKGIVLTVIGVLIFVLFHLNVP